MKSEAGKISNIDLQKSVARIFYYLCVVSFTHKAQPCVSNRRFAGLFQVTLQYVAPLVLILFLTLMYKTMGGGSWEISLEHSPLNAASNVTSEAVVDPPPSTEETVEAVVGQFSLAWQSLKQVL